MELTDLEQRLIRFNKLMTELMKGRIQRTTFHAWEVEILLDIESCELREANRHELLRRYHKAVNRFVERGGRDILKFSDYRAKKHLEPLVAMHETRSSSAAD